MRCSRVEPEEWPTPVPARGRATARLKLFAVEPGPFTIEQAFWYAEPTVLRRVPFTIRGSAE